jgi:hypothetical protein
MVGDLKTKDGWRRRRRRRMVAHAACYLPETLISELLNGKFTVHEHSHFSVLSKDHIFGGKSCTASDLSR